MGGVDLWRRNMIALIFGASSALCVFLLSLMIGIWSYFSIGPFQRLTEGDSIVVATISLSAAVFAFVVMICFVLIIQRSQVSRDPRQE